MFASHQLVLHAQYNHLWQNQRVPLVSRHFSKPCIYSVIIHCEGSWRSSITTRKPVFGLIIQTKPAVKNVPHYSVSQSFI